MFKKLAFGCLMVAALVGAVFYSVWRQATRLPDWYAETASAPSAEAASGESAAPSEAAPSAGAPAGSRAPAGSAPRPGAADRGPGAGDREPGAPLAATEPDRAAAPAPAPSAPPRTSLPAAVAAAGRVELGERQLNELLARSLDEHPRGQRLRRAVKGMRATIDGDRLELGVVTSLAALGAAAESESEAQAVRRLARLAPWLGDRDVYLALRGRPRARDGHLVLDRDGELRVGGITFDAADFATRLGVPEEKLDRGVELPLAGLEIEDVEVADGSLVLSLAER